MQGLRWRVALTCIKPFLCSVVATTLHLPIGVFAILVRVQQPNLERIQSNGDIVLVDLQELDVSTDTSDPRYDVELDG